MRQSGTYKLERLGYAKTDPRGTNVLGQIWGQTVWKTVLSSVGNAVSISCINYNVAGHKPRLEYHRQAGLVGRDQEVQVQSCQPDWQVILICVIMCDRFCRTGVW